MFYHLICSKHSFNFVDYISYVLNECLNVFSLYLVKIIFITFIQNYLFGYYSVICTYLYSR